MIDAPAPVTAADLLAKSKDSSHRYELMKGNLLTLSLANADHGAIALTIGAKPEIMSPAGYWPQLHAASKRAPTPSTLASSTSRARAKVGFTLDELPEVMRTLHVAA
jgi:hypothetical protein